MDWKHWRIVRDVVCSTLRSFHAVYLTDKVLSSLNGLRTFDTCVSTLSNCITAFTTSLPSSIIIIIPDHILHHDVEIVSWCMNITNDSDFIQHRHTCCCSCTFTYVEWLFSIAVLCLLCTLCFVTTIRFLLTILRVVVVWWHCCSPFLPLAISWQILGLCELLVSLISLSPSSFQLWWRIWHWVEIPHRLHLFSFDSIWSQLACSKLCGAHLKHHVTESVIRLIQFFIEDSNLQLHSPVSVKWCKKVRPYWTIDPHSVRFFFECSFLRTTFPLMSRDTRPNEYKRQS